MNLQKIIEIQDELIESIARIYGIHGDYHNKLYSEIASLKAQEESNELTDLKQYVTNLLYTAHGYGEASEGVNTPIFDKWAEEQTDNLDQYFAQSHQVEMPGGECNHVIGANDESGICIKCGKKVCSIVNSSKGGKGASYDHYTEY